MMEKILTLYQAMQKLVRYTNIEELKASKDKLPPQQSGSERKSELDSFIATLKNHSSTAKLSSSINPSNKPIIGK